MRIATYVRTEYFVGHTIGYTMWVHHEIRDCSVELLDWLNVSPQLLFIDP